MMLCVQFGREQKYVKLSELTFKAFLKEGENIDRFLNRQKCMTSHFRILLAYFTICFYYKLVCLKFNTPEDREPDMKVCDQSDTEIDSEVFEELVQESGGPFRIILSNEGYGNHSNNSLLCLFI